MVNATLYDWNIKKVHLKRCRDEEDMAMYKVEICGVNTAKLPLLTEEEKRELYKKIQSGDMDAREKFIKGNLRLVLSIIQRFSN